VRIVPETGGMQIVLLGQFNPAIFTPAWFTHNKLLREGLDESAQVQVIHPQIAAFTADWLHLQVTNDQFRAETQQAPYARLCELVVRTFSERLHHTPLTAFGINRNVHFLASDQEARARLEKVLVPLEPWGPLQEVLGLESGYGGMNAVQMSHRRPEGRSEGGQINVTIQPSVLVGEGRTGVFVGVNDHFVADEREDSARHLMNVLAGEFGPSRIRSDEIIDHIMSLTESEG